MHRIDIDGIEITVQKKQIKNMYIRVYPQDGNVKITAPLRTTNDAISVFAESRIEWIREQFQKYSFNPLTDKPKYITGESCCLLGKIYPLDVIYHESLISVFIKDQRVVLQVPKDSTADERAAVMDDWYRLALKNVVPPILAECESIVGVTAAEWRIKNMRTKWGTCNVPAKRIWLSLQLAKKEPECLEYIIIHELVHLLEEEHNDRFYAYMDRFCPDWRAIKDRLNGQSSVLGEE